MPARGIGMVSNGFLFLLSIKKFSFFRGLLVVWNFWTIAMVTNGMKEILGSVLISLWTFDYIIHWELAHVTVEIVVHNSYMICVVLLCVNFPYLWFYFNFFSIKYTCRMHPSHVTYFGRDFGPVPCFLIGKNFIIIKRSNRIHRSYTRST